MPSHQRSPRGRTKRIDMEINKSHRLGMKTVEVGRLENGIAMTAKVAVALIVGHDENDVWLGVRGGGEGAEKKCDEGGQMSVHVVNYTSGIAERGVSHIGQNVGSAIRGRWQHVKTNGVRESWTLRN